MTEYDENLRELPDDRGLELKESQPRWPDRVSGGFVVCVVGLAVLALAGQGLGLAGLIGFNRERSTWDAREIQRAELAGEIETLGAQEAKARASANGMEGQRRDALAAKDEAEEDYRAVAGNLAEATRSLTQARLDLVSAQTEAASAEDARDRARAELQRLTAEAQALEPRVEDLNSKLGDAKSQSEAFERRVQEVGAELVNVQSHLSATSGQLSTALAEVARQRELLGQATAATEAAERRHEDLNASLAAGEGRKAEVLNEVDRLAQEKASIGGQVITLQERLDTLRSQVAERSGELASLDVAHTKAVADRDNAVAELGELQALAAELRTEVRELQVSRANLDGEVRALRSQRENLMLTALEDLARAIADAQRAWSSAASMPLDALDQEPEADTPSGDGDGQ